VDASKLRVDVMFRDVPGKAERDLVALIERCVVEHAQRTGRAPAVVLAIGSEAPPDEVRQAMETIT
jgi:hypothetical protein